MTIKYADRVRETSLSTGAALLTLAGAVDSYRSINTVFNNDTDATGLSFDYVITHVTNNTFEVGTGHLTVSNVMSRDTVSINSDETTSKINFAGGGLVITVTPSRDTLADLEVETLVATSDFTSPGIDDNATSTQVTVTDTGTNFASAITAIGINRFSRVDTTPAGTPSNAFGDAVFGSTDSANSGITVFSNAQSGIALGDLAGNLLTQFRHQNSTNNLEIFTNNTLSVTIDASQNTTFVGALISSVTTGITAGTTQTQAGATALTTDINRVNNVAVNGDAVKLPDAVPGKRVTVINDDAGETIQVFPNTGDQIDAGGANNVDPNQIANGTFANAGVRVYVCITASEWISESNLI